MTFRTYGIGMLICLVFTLAVFRPYADRVIRRMRPDLERDGTNILSAIKWSLLAVIWPLAVPVFAFFVFCFWQAGKHPEILNVARRKVDRTFPRS